MRPDCDGTRCGLQVGRLLRGSLLSRLALTSIAVVVLAALAAGVGVQRAAHMVIVQGDMMTMDKLPTFLSQTRLYLALVALGTAVVAGVAAWLLFRQIIRPLVRIEQVAAAVAAGDYTQRVNQPGTDEVGRLASAIDSMTASLGQVEQLRRDLIANVAHELRTPLTATQGLLFAMRDGLMEPDHRNLEQAAEELGRLTRLVEALHQLSLTDSVPRGGLTCGPVEAVALVDEVLAGMMPLFEQRSIRVRWATPGEPVWVQANRDALVQVLVNLLDNAAKYTPEFGWAEVSVSTGGEVRVSNNGPGIGPGDLPRVFERFYRGEKSRSRETGGAGIGLAIVKNLAGGMGARVWAESAGGVTTFGLALARAHS